MKQNFQKNKAVTDKTPLFVIGLLHLFILTLGSDKAVLNGNDAFLILVLSTKKLYPSMLKEVFVFQKICFKFKIFKMFKISSDCHIKTCRSLKRRAILKISSIGFLEEPKWNL